MASPRSAVRVRVLGAVDEDGTVTIDNWALVLTPDRFGLHLRPGVSESALAGAAVELGSPLPDSLADFYRFTDGLFDGPGQWDVAWPLARLVEENSGRPLLGLLGFGDNGTGEWFAYRRIDGAVIHVSGITEERTPLAKSLWTFWSGWLSGEITI